MRDAQIATPRAVGFHSYDILEKATDATGTGNRSVVAGRVRGVVGVGCVCGVGVGVAAGTRAGPTRRA